MPNEKDASSGHGNAHKTTIFVNGRSKEWEKETISYADLLTLAFGDNIPSGPNVVITVDYSKGPDGKSGSLRPGESVKVKEKMVFDVTATDKS